MNNIYSTTLVPQNRCQNLLDMRLYYMQLTEEFGNVFYTQYDTSYQLLGKFFYTNAQITFMDNEMIGSSKFIEYLLNLGIYRINHDRINLNAQPLSDTTVIITTNGFLHFNYSNDRKRFVESFILERNNDNKSYISSYIFKITQ